MVSFYFQKNAANVLLSLQSAFKTVAGVASSKPVKKLSTKTAKLAKEVICFFCCL
jgi:hypothetical protein